MRSDDARHRCLRRWATSPLLIAVLCLSITAQEEDAGIRVENEFKLSVPDDQLEAVRMYLKKRYGWEDGSILREFGVDFDATISDEKFIDQYFDTPDLDLFNAECGVRKRQRWNLLDPSNDRKHGRQLLQLKLRRPSDPNPLNRTEVKFKIDSPGTVKSNLDRHPLLSLVNSDDRPALIQTLNQFGVDAHAMRPALTIEQRRWRVYISRGGSAFATLTLDEVASTWSVWQVAFVELEIELNENAFTEATPEDRVKMEQFSHRMADDIRSEFPSIKQDQTPKYNKIFHAFSHRIPGFKLMVFYPDESLIAGLIAAILLAILTVHIIRRIRQRISCRREGEHERA